MKRFLLIFFALVLCSSVFAQTYEELLSKAKQYENEKRWCYALGTYYDAMGINIAIELKTDAINGYKLLKEAILSGNPGIGSFNAFSIHDEWKNLLIDAEKYGCSFNPYEVYVGKLVQEKLDYTTKTATYGAKISYSLGNRYKYTIGIIEEGYKKAYKDDWNDLPRNWPKYSASYKKDDVCKVNDTYIFRADEYYGRKVIGYSYYNAFTEVDYPNTFTEITTTLIDCKFNIVDESGKELIKPKRFLLGMEDIIEFESVPVDIMDLIDKGKAFLNPVGCYLQYGKFNKSDATGGRSFIKNFPEIQLPMNTAIFICWNNKTDKVFDTFFNTMNWHKSIENLSKVNINLVKIPGKNFEIGKSEVTQELYEIGMMKNPSSNKSKENPVETVSWYDAIYFCNKLSIAKGLEPVYSLNGETDILTWNSTLITEGDISQNISANGYRIPTVEEWQYAAKGGHDYIYSGSNDLYSVAWYEDNSYNRTSPIAKKMPNGYGIYDMSGNVYELCWNEKDVNKCTCAGGSFSTPEDKCTVENSISSVKPNERYTDVGFRVARTLSDEETIQIESEIKTDNDVEIESETEIGSDSKNDKNESDEVSDSNKKELMKKKAIKFMKEFLEY